MKETKILESKIKEILDGPNSPSNTKTISERRVNEWGVHVPDNESARRYTGHKKWKKNKWQH